MQVVDVGVGPEARPAVLDVLRDVGGRVGDLEAGPGLGSARAAGGLTSGVAMSNAHLLASVTRSRAPGFSLKKRPSSVSFCPAPYRTAESQNVHPMSSAVLSVASDSASSTVPYTPGERDMVPRPGVGTLRPGAKAIVSLMSTVLEGRGRVGCEVRRV